MILVPKIGPHGLFDPPDAGLFLQLIESAPPNHSGHLVRTFRMSARVFE